MTEMLPQIVNPSWPQYDSVGNGHEGHSVSITLFQLYNTMKTRSQPCNITSPVIEIFEKEK